MALTSIARSMLGWLIVAALAGCSTAEDVGSSSGSGGTGGPPPDDEDDPAPRSDGDACSPNRLGWQTACNFAGEISYENPLVPGEYLELGPFVGTTVACCEGAPSTATADSACVDACIVELCRIAENVYLQIAQENDWYCTQGCRFDTEGCLAGLPVQQFPHPPAGENFPHEVTVSCEATNVQPRRLDGTFEFIDIPENEEYNDPPLCGPMTANGLEPLDSLAANTVVEDAGSYAMATWWSDTSGGQQSSSNLEIDAGYDLYPCGDTECLELTQLDATIPAGSYAGLQVQSGALTLVGVTAQPVVDRTGRFEFPPGSLHFVLTATMADARLSLTRTNATTTHGRVSHATDLFELTSVHLSYEDSDFGAELRLDLAGSHTNRAPRAAIRRLELPLGCGEPVVFEAASVDPEGDAMRHYWWTRDGMLEASSIEVVLSPGDHRIVLLSIDRRGSHDATSVAFTRRCT